MAKKKKKVVLPTTEAQRQVSKRIDIADATPEVAQGLREQEAARNEAANKARLANARKLRGEKRRRKMMASPATATFAGDTRDRELEKQATQPQATRLPIDARYTDQGQLDLSGVPDNQVLRQQDGTFVVYNVETRQASPVVFDVDRDMFVSEDYKTSEGFGNIKRRLGSSLSDLGRYALDTGDQDIQLQVQRLTREIDEVDNNESLRPAERDQLLVDLYNKNKTLFDTVDRFRVQTAGEQQQQAAQQAALQLQNESDKMDLKMQSARDVLFAGFEPGKSSLGNAETYAIPEEEVENAYSARTAARASYDEAFQEKLAELSMSNPDNPANVGVAHAHAFTTAGLGSREEAARSGMGPTLFPDRRQFEIEYRKQKGMDRRNAIAMADISRATGVIQAEIDALAEGPLSTPAYDGYIKTLVDSGVSRVEADRSYFFATLEHQKMMFVNNSMLQQLQHRRNAVLMMDEQVVGDITNAEVILFARGRGISVPRALSMLRESHLQTQNGTTPFQVENKRKVAAEATSKVDSKAKAPSRRDRAGGPKS